MIHIAFDIAARARAEWQQRLQKEKQRSAAEIARRVKIMLDIDVDEPTYPLTINDITFSLHNNGIYEALVILRPCPGCGNKMPSNAIHNYADLGFELQCAQTLCSNCDQRMHYGGAER